MSRDPGRHVLTILRDRLAPFAEKHLSRAYPDSYRRILGIDRLAGATLGRGGRKPVDDPDELLGILLNAQYWSRAFEPAFGGDTHAGYRVKNLAHDIRDLRAAFAMHRREFTPADAWRLVDSTVRLLDLLELLDPETSASLEEIRRGLQAAGDSPDLSGLRKGHLAHLATRFEYVDVGAIAPSVDGSVVRLRLDDIYRTPSFQPIHRPATAPASDDPATARVTGPGQAEVVGPTEVLGERRLLIVAGPGAGKSTFLRSVARGLALGRDMPGLASLQTPILVAASALGEALANGTATSLEGYVEGQLAGEAGPALAADIAAGRAILLVDGVDEVGAQGAQVRVAQALERFAAAHPSVPMVVTARPLGYREVRLGGDFTAYNLLPLGGDEVSAFIDGWFSAAFPHDDPADNRRRSLSLDRLIVSSAELTDLAGTPLLLTVICLLAMRGGALPERRIELFRVATNTLLHQWPRAHGFDLDDYELRLLMGRVAARILERRDRLLRASELRRLLEEGLEEMRGLGSSQAGHEAADMLHAIEQQTGFLVEQGVDSGEPVYGFIHRNFAEYLAALDLFERYVAGTIKLADFVFDPGYGEAVPLFFLNASEMGLELSSRLVDEVLALDPPFRRHARQAERLAIDLLAQGVRVKPRVRERALLLAIEAAVAVKSSYIADGLMEALGRLAADGKLDPERELLVDRVEAAPFSRGRRARVSWSLRSRPYSSLDVRGLLDEAQALATTEPDETLLLLKLAAEAAEPDVADGEETPGPKVLPRPLLLAAAKGPASEDPIPVGEARAARLVEAGVLRVSAGDLAASHDVPPGFVDGLFVLDLSDVELVNLDDLQALDLAGLPSWVLLLIARQRLWSPAEAVDAARRIEQLPEQAEEGTASTAIMFLMVILTSRVSELMSAADMPDWVRQAIEARAADPDLALVLGLGLIGTAVDTVTAWGKELLVSLLSHSDAPVRMAACRQVGERQALERWTRSMQFQLDEDVIAGLELLRDDPDPHVRSEAWRTAALMGKVPPRLVAALGEDGATVEPDEPVMLPVFATLLVWLLLSAAEPRNAGDGHLFAAQLGRLLDWRAKPVLAPDDVWRLLPDFPEHNRIPADVRESAWARTDSADPVTRAWAAAAWASCLRTLDARNQVQILLGDGDTAVRMAGLLALQPPDVGDAIWIPEAVEPLLEADVYIWEYLLAPGGLDPTPDYRRELGRVFARALDAAPTVENQVDLLMGYAMGSDAG